MAMSGPMPAGSPGVRARMGAIRLFAAFDHGALAQLAQILLRFLFEAFGLQILARLLAARRIGLALVLGAHCKHLNAKPRDLGRGQLADWHAVEDLAEVLG